MACNAQPSCGVRWTIRSQEELKENQESTITSCSPRNQIPRRASQCARHCSHRKGRTNSCCDHCCIYCYRGEISPARQVRANSHSPVSKSYRASYFREKTTSLRSPIPAPFEPCTEDRNLQALNLCRCQQHAHDRCHRAGRNPLSEASLPSEVLRITAASVPTQREPDGIAEFEGGSSSMDEWLGSVDVGYIVSPPGICEILALAFFMTAMILAIMAYQGGFLSTFMIFGMLFGWLSAGFIFFTKLCFAAHNLNYCYCLFICLHLSIAIAFGFIATIIASIQTSNGRLCPNGIAIAPERALRRLQVGAVNADLEHKSTVCRITYLVFMTMAVLFLVGSVVLLAIYFASADLVVSFVGSSDNSDSLSGGLSSSSKKIAEFFEEGIEGGKEKTNAAVKNLVDQAKTEVANGLSENIDSLLEYLQIPQTLQYGKSSLNELKTARDKADKTLTNLQTLKEAFEKYEEDIDKLKNEYKGKLNCQPQSDSGCPDIDKLESPIKSSNLESPGLEAYKSALENVVLELSDQLDKVQETLDRSFESQ
ncbi:hypothetical protein Aperf_G00000045690 [Anoplocephala perfoliata]